MKIYDIVKDKLSDVKYNRHIIVNTDVYNGEIIYELKNIVYIALPTIWRYEKDIEIIKK
jgi:hypothetical protein